MHDKIPQFPKVQFFTHELLFIQFMVVQNKEGEAKVLDDPTIPNKVKQVQQKAKLVEEKSSRVALKFTSFDAGKKKAMQRT